MSRHYTDEKNAQIIIALLKQHGIKRVVASPGTTNMAFVGSIQNDPFFEIYSSVDERSAAYMACGLAAETGSPVVISCTGATASRNYLPGLTEAFYRKLPVLALTSTPAVTRIGHNIPQIIDRSVLPKDVVKLSLTLPFVATDDDFWDCEIKVNRAILELFHNGGGPVHLNLQTSHSNGYAVFSLPSVRTIKRISFNDNFPELAKGKIAIFIGSHSFMSQRETELIDRFCASNNAVVFCDHTSSYRGKYRVLFSLVACQQHNDKTGFMPDLLIHLGEVSGDYYTLGLTAKEVWRVNPDGEIRDTFRKLTYVFEMQESIFFEKYLRDTLTVKNNYYDECNNALVAMRKQIPELPFSNMWIASQMAHRIPENSVIHFGILNSLRSWNFFELPESVKSSSNVGGFGIDGCMSTLVGASLSNPDSLYFLIIGDLAFFYDMNVLGNRYKGNNIRILLVNNGKGTEFKNYNHPGLLFEDDADMYISAAGHFGNKSTTLVRHYSEDLGFKYICAHNKEEFLQVFDTFLEPDVRDRPIIFENFTRSEDESNALKNICNIYTDFKVKAKGVVKNLIGENATKIIQKVIK